eukprot:TRINITY_DN5148_c0_g2_i11.p1 TRINITY_DN5148_c0_g2~~TRINITY_DN5148_c0_g2_i11.p1  ORF type:complete len:151 (+),score=18.31 TRINITY_DN5148_c0_g2_i11:141-593(+)
MLKYFSLFLLGIFCPLVWCSLSTLTSHNFTQAVVESDKIWVVAFYSPHCSACVQFQKNWNALINSGEKGLQFGVVNIDEKDGFMLAADMGVFDEGIPNIKVFPYEFDGTGIGVWNGVGQPTVTDLEFKLQGILGDYIDDGKYRKLPYLVI